MHENGILTVGYTVIRQRSDLLLSYINEKGGLLCP